MDTHTQGLIGSPARDKFKHWHKTLDNRFYALDADLFLVNKNPEGIIALLDYKRPSDTLTFTEVLAYNHLLRVGIQIWLIESIDCTRFTIAQYVGGDWHPRPPTFKLNTVLRNGTGKDYAEWEQELRQQWIIQHNKR